MDYIFFEELYGVDDFRKTYDVAVSMADNPSVVLDMAGGAGLVGKLLAHRGIKYVNVDSNPFFRDGCRSFSPVVDGNVLRLDEIVGDKFDTIFLLNFYYGIRTPSDEDFGDPDRLALIHARDDLKVLSYRLVYAQAANAIEQDGTFIISGFYTKDTITGTIKYLKHLGFAHEKTNHVLLSEEAGTKFVEHDLWKRIGSDKNYQNIIEFYMHNFHILSFKMNVQKNIANLLLETKEEYFAVEEKVLSAERLLD